MAMSYAIICDASQRSTDMHGIVVMAMVDRRKEKDLWWTTDNENLIMEFTKKSAAQYSCRRLIYNNPRVVEYDVAVRHVIDQAFEISNSYDPMQDVEMGWDAHKDIIKF